MTDPRADRRRVVELEEALREAIEAARDFNRGGMTWREYDALLARLSALAAAGEPEEDRQASKTWNWNGDPVRPAPDAVQSPGEDRLHDVCDERIRLLDEDRSRVWDEVTRLRAERDKSVARGDHWEAQVGELDEVLREMADRCEADRREADKILCHVAWARRQALDAALSRLPEQENDR